MAFLNSTTQRRFAFAAVASLMGAASLVLTAANAENSHGHDTDHGQFGASEADISDALKGTYEIEPTHAYISATYNHLGFSYPVLAWRTFGGTLNIDPENLADMSLNVTIDATSIDSRVEVFDGHLKAEQFFNVEKFPEITFTSTAAMPETENRGKVAGDLTIKGITKPVVLDVVLHKAGKNPINGSDVIGVSAKGTIKRSEWDLGLYAPNVSDEVALTISVEFKKK